MNKAVFFDRDGVINESVVKNGKPYPPVSLQELIFVPGIETLCQQFIQQGYWLFVVTNQPDVGRGIQTQAAVETIHEAIMMRLPFTDIAVCYHAEDNQCDCRKPKPGMIFSLAERYNIRLDQSIVIGDRWKDIAAGQAAGCQTVWLNRGYDEPIPNPPADFEAGNLHDIMRHFSG